MKEETYQITLLRPEGATVEETKTYIRDALMSHGGAFHPDDAFFAFKQVKKIGKVPEWKPSREPK